MCLDIVFDWETENCEDLKMTECVGYFDDVVTWSVAASVLDSYPKCCMSTLIFFRIPMIDSFSVHSCCRLLFLLLSLLSVILVAIVFWGLLEHIYPVIVLFLAKKSGIRINE